MSMAGGSDFDLGVTVRSFAAGQKLFGRYTLIRALGRGGMGVVWLARDSDLEREVALKFLPEMVAADPVAIDDLKHETRRSLELTHPHIVRVHDFIQDNGIAAISMEFVRGRTLAEVRLEQPSRAFDVAGISRWLQQVCEALHYAHVQARVVHRDLKPANVMVDDRNRIKLTDFGISATVSDTVTRVSRLATTGGTAAYASPQQLMGEPACAADDIYALGATIYELLTSRPPFFTGNLLLQVQNRVPPPMAERRKELEVAGAEIPTRWEELVAAALSKNPQERPATIEEFAHRLDLAGAFPSAAGGGTEDFSLTRAATVVSRGPSTKPPSQPPPVPAGSSTKPPAIAAPNGAGAAAVSTAAPASAPAAAAAPRKKSKVGWVLVVLLLVAAGAGLWLGDVPNRFLAAQLVKEGQRATVESDLDAATQAFREALLKRPGDAAIREQLETSQERWLAALRTRIASTEPAEALQQLESAAAGAGARLIGAASGEFRQLLDTTRAAVREAGEREIRNEIEAALRKADDGDVAAALTELDGLAQRGVLVDEIEAARKTAGGRAVRANVARLAEAIESNDARELQEVFQRATGRPADAAATSAAGVLGAKDPEAFLAGIEQGGVQLAVAAFDTLPSDLALVEASRTRFSDTDATKGFLGRRHAEAAQAFLDNGLPGFALYAAGLARAEGASVDPRLEREAREKLENEFDFTIHFSDTAQAGANRDAIMPVADARKALRGILDPKAGDWMKIVELAPLASAGAIELKTRMSELGANDNPVETGDSVRYQDGSRSERNPEYERVERELADARRNAADLEAQVARMERGGDSRTEAVLRGIAEFGLRMNATQARQKADALERELQTTPREIRTPVYKEERFQRIAHHLTYSASFTATPALQDREIGNGVVWSAGTKHETTEVTGDASRGVPVQGAVYPAMGLVANMLAEAIANEIRKGSEPLLRALVAASFSRLDAMLKDADASRAAVADRRWGLAQFWANAGVPVPQAGELEEAVREQLGLPEGRLAAPPPAAAPVVETRLQPVPESKKNIVNGAPATMTYAEFLEAHGTPKTLQNKDSPAKPETRNYIVRSGDTLRSVTQMLGVTARELETANPGITRRRLRAGQVLVVPPGARGSP
ncbi:MAG: protein kinase domain-containing protein [Opitutaceae bacterium]